MYQKEKKEQKKQKDYPQSARQEEKQEIKMPAPTFHPDSKTNGSRIVRKSKNKVHNPRPSN